MSARAPKLVDAGECPMCLNPPEDCDCGGIERAILVRRNEDEVLRGAADRAIRRGYIVLTRHRSLWVRLRDAWHAFWHGLS